MWDGERYVAAGGGFGNTTFGPYLSSRVPPNLWDKMWYYLRFMFADVNDPENQSTMDQKGEFEDAAPGEHSQFNTDAVTLFQASVVADATTAGEGTVYYIPFPEPPMAAIRGIQIFRSQVVPVTSEFPNGTANPNAVPEAWRACHGYRA